MRRLSRVEKEGRDSFSLFPRTSSLELRPGSSTGSTSTPLGMDLCHPLNAQAPIPACGMHTRCTRVREGSTRSRTSLWTAGPTAELVLLAGPAVELVTASPTDSDIATVRGLATGHVSLLYWSQSRMDAGRAARVRAALHTPRGTRACDVERLGLLQGGLPRVR